MIGLYEPICVRPALATEAGFHVRPAKASDPDQRLHCLLRRGPVAAIYDELLTRLEEGR